MAFSNEFLIDEDVYTVEILSLNNEMVMMVNGTRYIISRTSTDASSTLKINNKEYKTFSADTKNDVYLKVESETYHLEKKKVRRVTLPCSPSFTLVNTLRSYILM